jgi:malonyl CoA-acyl carrier protein transacylase
MTAFVFPGQGSQHKGMGSDLFNSVAEFKAIESQVEEILGYSVREQCLNDPGGVLSQTEYTQPCLYVVNALHYYKALADGESADYLAGHSLGEYNALLAAGAFDFLTGLKLVQKRGELMAKVRDGGMAAVIGLDTETLNHALKDNGLDSIDVANYNAPDQIVISGPSEDIDRAKDVVEGAGAKLFSRLSVSGAFHSRYMADASKEFQSFLADFQFHRPELPVIANVTGQPYPPGDPDLTIGAFLSRQMTQSVKWVKSMQYLMELGETDIHEKGPGTVLTKLVEKNRMAEAG